VTGIDEVILRVFKAQTLRIATVYLKLLQRRKSTKEQAETVSLFRHNPLVADFTALLFSGYSWYKQKGGKNKAALIATLHIRHKKVKNSMKEPGKSIQYPYSALFVSSLANLV